MTMFQHSIGVASLMLASLFVASAAQAADPIVIAHRGASGYLPEHTLAGYELAVKMGADYIEPDLQFTSDGVLVAMHDSTMSRTTNIASLFAPRNGGYRVSDFTLAEIKTLTVVPPAGGTSKPTYPGFTPTNPVLRVPTFQEVIDLAKQQSAVSGRKIGIYPEAKQADPAMEDAILTTLAANGYGKSTDKLFIQSFSDTTIRSINTKSEALGMDIDLVVLGGANIGADGIARLSVTGGKLLTFEDLASFSEGIGVSLSNAITADFIAQAHAAGLEVHGWTFSQMDPDLAAAQYQRYLDMGMDGFFSNYTDLAVATIHPEAAVPELDTWAMMFLGLGGVGVALRRRRAAGQLQAA